MTTDLAPDGELLLVNYGPGSEGPLDNGAPFSIDAAISLAEVDADGDTVAALSVWIRSRELARGNTVAPRWRVTVELTSLDLLYLVGAMANTLAPHLKASIDDVADALRKT
jgi:hypothetical protein